MLNQEALAMLSEYISTAEIPVSRPLFPISSGWVCKIIEKYARMLGLPETIHPHNCYN
jgi:hypothetical protein